MIPTWLLIIIFSILYAQYMTAFEILLVLGSVEIFYGSLDSIVYWIIFLVLFIINFVRSSIKVTRIFNELD